MTEVEIDKVYGELVDIARLNEVEPDEFVQILATLCLNIVKSINIHNDEDRHEATITFDDGATVQIKLGDKG